MWHIGIDLGAQEVGFALLKVEGSTTFYLEKAVGLALGSRPLEERLTDLHRWLADQLMATPQESVVWMEEPFVGKSVRSALMLGTAKGLLWGLLLSLGRPAPVALAAVQVKKAVTGRAHASKEQLAAMLQHYLLPPYQLPDNLHITDAIAIAIAGASLQNSPITRRFTSRAER
ncbi:MAG: hypothetical protein KatS3mg025_1155 [Bacteroidia bacterium]|jgi:crossover junction endodeoxyribonuclease RuvC|nr:MAG: hypothetical protein KatS3mg025_1155 [Bacteroidia bacterium]